MHSTQAGSVNALVGHFYRAALEVPLAEFRQQMLQDVKTLIPFDAALWGTGAADSESFHTLTLLGLDARFSEVLESTRDINPMLAAVSRNLENPTDMAEILPDEAFYASEVYETVCRPFNIHRVLGSAYLDEESGLYTFIGLFRFDPEDRFSEDDRRIQKHLIFHLMNAAAIASSVHLQKQSEADSRYGIAICDRLGFCYGCHEQFVKLVRSQFTGWDGQRLPFELPEKPAGGRFNIKGLRFNAEPQGDLFCLRVWREGPLDSLTEREREIVASVCRGLSYKEVARPLGIAPSTVSNHLYRVFEKLGITSRTQLAKLVGESVRLH